MRRIFSFLLILSFIFTSCGPNTSDDIIKNKNKLEGKVISVEGVLTNYFSMPPFIDLVKLSNPRTNNYVFFISTDGSIYNREKYRNEVIVIDDKLLSDLKFYIPTLLGQMKLDYHTPIPIQTILENEKKYLKDTVLISGKLKDEESINSGRGTILTIDDQTGTIEVEVTSPIELDEPQNLYIVGIPYLRGSQMAIEALYISSLILNVQDLPAFMSATESYLIRGAIKSEIKTRSYFLYSFHSLDEPSKSVPLISYKEFTSHIDESDSAVLILARPKLVYLDKLLSEIKSVTPILGEDSWKKKFLQPCNIYVDIQADLVTSKILRKFLEQSTMPLYFGDKTIGYLVHIPDAGNRMLFKISYDSKYKYLWGEGTNLGIHALGVGFKVSIDRINIFNDYCQESDTIPIKYYFSIKPLINPMERAYKKATKPQIKIWEKEQEIYKKLEKKIKEHILKK